MDLLNSIYLSVDVADIHAMKEAIKIAKAKFEATDCSLNNDEFFAEKKSSVNVVIS